MNEAYNLTSATPREAVAELEAAIGDLPDNELSEDSIMDGSEDSEDEVDEVNDLLAS
jgi:hypothetical protein